MPNLFQTLCNTYLTNPAATLQMLPELFKQYEDGLIKTLPCKVGDTAYRIILGKIEKCTVRGFAGGQTIETVYLEYQYNGKIYGCSADVETVFFTRESAEKALKESEP